MSNIQEQAYAPEIAHARLFNKPILTPSEAAQFLGISKCTLKAYNVPRHYMNLRNHWYLLSELEQWVRALPTRGEMPTDDEYALEIRVV